MMDVLLRTVVLKSELSAIQCHGVDDSFGPTASKCRFDFTLLFEESILFLGPSALFLILAGWRFWQLQKEQMKVRQAKLRVLKIVSVSFIVVT
jgi:hypothetical protein